MGIWTANMLNRKIKVASKMFLAVYSQAFKIQSLESCLQKIDARTKLS